MIRRCRHINEPCAAGLQRVSTQNAEAKPNAHAAYTARTVVHGSARNQSTSHGSMVVAHPRTQSNTRVPAPRAQTPAHTYEARCMVCSGTGWARNVSNGRRGHLHTCIACHGLGECMGLGSEGPGLHYMMSTRIAASPS